MIEIKPETSGFGAEIVGVNLADTLADSVFEEIKAAIVHHKVLTFRDQYIDDAGHYAFASRFGTLEGHINRSSRLDSLPKLQVFGNVDAEGKITGEHPEKGTLVWHSDKEYVNIPSLFKILRYPYVSHNWGHNLFSELVRAYGSITL